MIRSIITGLLFPLLSLAAIGWEKSVAGPKGPDPKIETVQKLIVSAGTLDLQISPTAFGENEESIEKKGQVGLHFALASDPSFIIVVNNNLLRGPRPGSLQLVPQNTASLPLPFANALRQLVLEKTSPETEFDLVIRDALTGFVFFNIEGHQYQYDAPSRSFSIREGRLLVSSEFAQQLGWPDEGIQLGTLSLTATLQPIEIRTIVNGEVQSAELPPLPARSIIRSLGRGGAQRATPTLVAGPDVIVGEVISVEQPTGSSGINGSFVGLGLGTFACNAGDQPFHWFATPDNDHPVISQYLYRMSGGSGSSERFEQIGQSWGKHAFAADEGDACSFGCNTNGCTQSTNLCPGCADPYSANLNYAQSFLGSHAWINPFTGAYPRGDSATPPNNHTGHTHTGTSHRITVAMSDLNTLGATYFGEGHYVTPHEYTWCQANPGQCNMYNNVSYRRFTTSTSDGMHFNFAPVGASVRMQPALMAWTGATLNQFEPDPGADGIGFVGSKVTNPSAGVWHYEYAVYNQNLDRAIQSFSVLVGLGTNVSNIGFHAPPQEPGFANDGTVGDAGYSSAPWNSNLNSGTLTWVSETFAQNQNANAIRWGTLYNFRFDCDRPPQSTNATLGFFKAGSPVMVGIQAPLPGPTPTPTPFGATPTPSSTPTPSLTPTPTPTPTPVALVSLPIAGVDVAMTNFTQPITTSTINSADNLTGFQGDFTFDSTIITFQNPPVSNAGLTSGNWNVTASLLPGPGPIRTLHISGSSNDFTPLSGAGILLNLNMTRVSTTLGASTALTWGAAPNDFVFVDNNLNSHMPASTPPGRITVQGIVVSGAISYCSNPSPGPVGNVALTLSGSSSGTTLSDASGSYSFVTLISGGSYTVTPAKTGLPPAASGISTIDVLATQRHFLSIVTLSGCRLAAADVNGDAAVNTVDIIAIQRFYLGLSTGLANVGNYRFNPVNRSYPGVTTNQPNQNYDAFILGDVASPYVDPSF